MGMRQHMRPAGDNLRRVDEEWCILPIAISESQAVTARSLVQVLFVIISATLYFKRGSDRIRSVLLYVCCGVEQQVGGSNIGPRQSDQSGGTGVGVAMLPLSATPVSFHDHSVTSIVQ